MWHHFKCLAEAQTSEIYCISFVANICELIKGSYEVSVGLRQDQYCVMYCRCVVPCAVPELLQERGSMEGKCLQNTRLFTLIRVGEDKGLTELVDWATCLLVTVFKCTQESFEIQISVSVVKRTTATWGRRWPVVFIYLFIFLSLWPDFKDICILSIWPMWLGCLCSIPLPWRSGPLNASVFRKWDLTS